MKNEHNVTHERFYVYAHQGDKSEVMFYLNPAFSRKRFSTNFADAFLFDNLISAVATAKEDSSKLPNREEYFLCVGKVDVSVNGYFVPVVVGRPDA